MYVLPTVLRLILVKTKTKKLCPLILRLNQTEIDFLRASLNATRVHFTDRPAGHVTLCSGAGIDRICSQSGVCWLTSAVGGTLPHWCAAVKLPCRVASVEKLRVLQRVAFLAAGLKLRCFSPKCVKSSQGELLRPAAAPARCSPHADGAERTSPER